MWTGAGAMVLAAIPGEGMILLVDDDLNSREGLKLSLILDGYRVHAVGDTWQTIRSLKELRFDLAIIDLDLPPFQDVEITGWDLARIVRAYQHNITVIVVGADDGSEARSQAAAAGVALFLEKPVSPARVKAVIRQLRACGCTKTEAATPAERIHHVGS
jgi:DNA-binding response OmpR family regulator